MEIAQHKQRVWQVSRHPTLPFFASVSADKTAQIRSLPSFDLVKDIHNVHERSIRSLSWRPNFPTIAFGSFDSTLSIFSLEEPSWEFLAQLEGHDNEVKCVAWSNTGQYLASCSRDKSVWIWEVDIEGEEFECCAVLQEHTQDVKCVVWHRKEEVLASASYDNMIRLYRRDDDEFCCVATLEGHKSTVWCVDFDPVNMRLVSAGDDLTIKVWERVGQSGGTGSEKLPSVARWDVLVEEWVLLMDLPVRHTQPIYSVKWGNGKIVSGGGDGRIVVYNVDDWSVETVIDRAHGVYEVNSVDFLSDNEVVSGGDDGKVKLWKLNEIK